MYFNKDRLTEIKLKDGSVPVGKLISFYHNENDEIDRWHFLDKNEIEKYNEFAAPVGGSEYGKVIN